MQIQNDALVKVGNDRNLSSTSKLDYKSDPVHKLMLHNHGVGDGKFKFISTGTEVVLSG
jgi:hypothetical protein